MFGYDLGIDLGTSKIAISVPGKGVVLNEPSYVAFDTETEKILYAGRRAYFLQGREPQGVSVVQPIKDGVISNYSLTQQMVHYFINRVIKKNIFKPRVVAAVPALATDVEKRTLVSVIITAGARSVCLIEEPLCAAFGAGIDPIHPSGVFVIDIGGGRSDMAVVSQGSMSQTETVSIAGDAFDEAIVRYFKEKYQVLIGLRTAEEIKKSIGCAVPRAEAITIAAKGRSLESGLPEIIEVSSTEICDCLRPLLYEITNAAKLMFERTSPQLVSDITSGEVLLTGGSAELYGLDTLFAKELSLDVRVVPQPNLCVAKGASVALSKMHILDNYGYGFKTKEDVRIR
ncbi:MAG: rod shape-determining protein [Eubacterium sp.]|nr:rod shape-determining protein [Eubacterium sp.]